MRNPFRHPPEVPPAPLYPGTSAFPRVTAVFSDGLSRVVRASRGRFVLEVHKTTSVTDALGVTTETSGWVEEVAVYLDPDNDPRLTRHRAEQAQPYYSLLARWLLHLDEVTHGPTP